jgi:arylsulfatase A-like enzyme
MSSPTIRSSLAVILWICTFIILITLVCINLNTVVKGGSLPENVINNGFLSLLEQSKTPASVSAAKNKVNGATTRLNGDRNNLKQQIESEIETLTIKKDQLDTELRIGEMEDKIRSMNEAFQQWESEGKFNNLLETDLDSEAKPKPNENDSNELTGMNILLLYADDWTHHTLSSYHKTKPLNTILKTPVLDALAADGIRFTHNCVTTSVCWISRATLYTGQYMSRHGTTKPCCWSGLPKTKGMMDTVPDNWKELSMYEILKENGYHVGHAGKWGIHLPWEKNIDFNVEDDGWHYRKIGKKVWHITEKNEADALRFLVTRPKDKPFFLNVAFFATHAKDSDIRQYMPQETSMELYKDDTIPIPPTNTQEAWEKMPPFFDDRNEGRTRYKARFANYTLHQTMMKNYYRMATEVDTACGVILEELRRQDALNNTMIIFTTDNGNFHSEHGLADKWYPHQESIRVPLIIHDPRMADSVKGTTNDEFTLNIDLAPTILKAAGVSVPDKMHGRDMSELYLSPDRTDWRTEFFYEHPIISTKFCESFIALIILMIALLTH